ncbi:MAG: type restriction enzyme methylase subunit, partial [Daejeonella sp.]|nr:type restriction enzyme methylase subunit [Daejeonella sp.]
INKEVVAVIELKDTGTPDLDRVSTQAFGYKHKHKNCHYVMTSNFEKLRFYINDATDFEEFNLFALSKERFAVLYLCLQQKQLQQNIPLQVKQNSLAQEENVTKKLYADYSLFKRQLFQQIAEHNTKYDKLLLFKKTQKLLDRFLFILFAEDRMLLPPNSVREILAQWQQLKDLDNYVPLYERFKKYFGYLNTGHVGKHHEIFAYNGGLFSADDVLDKIVIDDEILYNGTKALSNYDFETDIDVNILGHIFEHSLTEIEELQSALKGQVVEKNRTKRKKEGVFYTPRYITKYIVENTVGKLCTQKKEELQINEESFAPNKRKPQKKMLLEKIEAYRSWLLQVTICDPACGSGAFLNAALEFLKAEHGTLDELKARIFGDAIVYTDIDNSILENNLYGVDLNEDAIEIAKLSLWLHTAKKGRKLSNLSNNIKVGNSLIDDKIVAGDKAFNWKKEFKSVFDKGGFDVVFGNPPYVNSKGDMHKDSYKTYWIKHYNTAIYQIDTYLLFIELSKKITSREGILSLIIPNAWLNNVFLAPVRKYVLQSMAIDSIIKTPKNTFPTANVDTIIISIKEYNSTNSISFRSLNVENEILEGKKLQTSFLLDHNCLLVFRKEEAHDCLINKIENESIPLHRIVSIARGVGIYHKRVGHTKDFIEQDPYFNKAKKDNTFVPYLRGKNINRYSIVWNNDSFISYGKWLAEPRELKYFEGERVILRQIPGIKNLFCTFLEQKFIIDQSVFIGLNEKYDFDTKYLTAVIGSRLLAWYFRNKYSEFDDLFPKVKLQHFKDFPIKAILKEGQLNFAKLVDVLLTQNQNLSLLLQQFAELLQAKFASLDLSAKLHSWPSLLANEFLKELSKQKIKLPLSEQQEWLQYFEEQKTKVYNIQQVIQQTEKEIDYRVYALYGLSDAEVAIVEEEDSYQ